MEHISQYLAQLGELADEPALKVWLFPLSLSGPAFSWFASLPFESITSWGDLENKFHTYFNSGITERGLADLVDLKQGNTEPASHFIQRFRDMRNQCYSLALSDQDIVNVAIRGLLPAVRGKIGIDCSNLGMLINRISSLKAQNRYNSRYAKIQRASMVDPAFCQLEEIVEDTDEDDMAREIVAVNWVWKHAEYIPWAKESEVDQSKKCTFDIAKTERIFDYLLEQGQIKLTGNHRIPSVEELKRRRYCKFHNSYNHTTNECRILREHIQKAIDSGNIGLEKVNGKMKIDQIPSRQPWAHGFDVFP